LHDSKVGKNRLEPHIFPNNWPQINSSKTDALFGLKK